MRPKDNIGPLAGLGGRLEFVGQFVRYFDFHRNTRVFLKFFRNFGQAAVALVTPDPDQEFPIGPGKRRKGRTKKNKSGNDLSDHPTY
jgi:hypothetical protein